MGNQAWMQSSFCQMVYGPHNQSASVNVVGINQISLRHLTLILKFCILGNEPMLHKSQLGWQECGHLQIIEDRVKTFQTPLQRECETIRKIISLFTLVKTWAMILIMEYRRPDIYLPLFKQLRVSMGFAGGSVVKNLPANRRGSLNPWVKKIPWRRE